MRYLASNEAHSAFGPAAPAYVDGGLNRKPDYLCQAQRSSIVSLSPFGLLIGVEGGGLGFLRIEI